MKVHFFCSPEYTKIFVLAFISGEMVFLSHEHSFFSVAEMFVRQTKAATLSATLAALFITQPTSSDKGKLVIYSCLISKGMIISQTRGRWSFRAQCKLRWWKIGFSRLCLVNLPAWSSESRLMRVMTTSATRRHLFPLSLLTDRCDSGRQFNRLFCPPKLGRAHPKLGTRRRREGDRQTKEGEGQLWVRSPNL